MTLTRVTSPAEIDAEAVKRARDLEEAEKFHLINEKEKAVRTNMDKQLYGEGMGRKADKYHANWRKSGVAPKVVSPRDALQELAPVHSTIT